MLVTICKSDTKDTSGRYIIPVDTWKPMDKESIRTVLVALLAIKNRPESISAAPTGINELKEYLAASGYIEDCIEFNSAILTDRGMDVATSGKAISIDWPNAAQKIISVLGSVASLWGLIS